MSAYGESCHDSGDIDSAAKGQQETHAYLFFHRDPENENVLRAYNSR
jgi:hypothetical protein